MAKASKARETGRTTEKQNWRKRRRNMDISLPEDYRNYTQKDLKAAYAAGVKAERERNVAIAHELKTSLTKALADSQISPKRFEETQAIRDAYRDAYNQFLTRIERIL